MRRWEYRQETFATEGMDETRLPPWENRLLPGAPREFLTEADWLNALGVDGWELLMIEDARVTGRLGARFVAEDGTLVHQRGPIPAKRWTFKREVPA